MSLADGEARAGPRWFDDKRARFPRSLVHETFDRGIPVQVMFVDSGTGVYKHRVTMIVVDDRTSDVRSVDLEYLRGSRDADSVR